MQKQVFRPRNWIAGLRIEHVWALSVLFVIFFFASTHPLRPHDFWWHLRAGQVIAATGAIPTVDQFSYTMAGTPYDNFAAFWLVELAFFGLYSLGGPASVIFSNAVVITAACAVLLVLCWQVSGNWRAAAAGTFFAALLGYNDWNVRPQDAAFLLGAIFLWAIYAYRRQPRSWLLAVFPMTMLLWANSHGSFTVGFLMLGIWLANAVGQALYRRVASGEWISARQVVPPAAALGLSAMAALVNPRGAGLISYVGSLAANPAVQKLATEWAAPSFGTVSGTIFFLGLLLVVVLLVVSPLRPGLFEVLTLLLFAGLALRTSRGISWFGLALAPIVSRHLVAAANRVGSMPDRRVPEGSVREGDGRQYPVLNYLIAAGLVVGMVFSTPWLKDRLPLPAFRRNLISDETPVVATDFMKQQQLPGKLFHEMGFGSYLIWAAYPDYQVFVDPRIELYPLSLWQEYQSLSAAEGDWQQRLVDMGVNTLMLGPKNQRGLVEAARQSPNWRQVYTDPAAVIFIRTGGPPTAEGTP
ncbi:MAG: hypothetical protein U9R25_20350 [Chloroflexota bacterium]|nr:hypothetical protein [Chloroflexota bacterium]